MGNIEIMAVLFSIVLAGYAAGRLGYMGGDFDKRLSSLIIDITCPALIISSTMSGTLPDRQLILPLLGISLLTYIILTGVAFLLPRLLTRRRDDEGIIGFALMFGNVSFIGYPVVASIFGHEAVFYAAVLNMVNTFAVFTIGTMLLTKESPNDKSQTSARPKDACYQRDARNLKSQTSNLHSTILYSSPMIAVYLAMIIVAFGIDNIPYIISQPLTLIGNITVPAALLIIGSSMSKLSLRTMLGNRTVYATTLFRLGLLPLGLYALTTVMGFSPLVVSINTVVIAMPVATYGTILCLKLGRDTSLITELTFITTLLSVITIPLLVMLLR